MFAEVDFCRSETANEAHRGTPHGPIRKEMWAKTGALRLYRKSWSGGKKTKMPLEGLEHD